MPVITRREYRRRRLQDAFRRHRRGLHLRGNNHGWIL